MLVLDGNMKKSWEVCYAIQAGHTEFNGLPGSVQTGCPNTPSYKSRYCAIHAPITAIPYQIEFSEDGNPKPKPANPPTPSEERQAAIIIGKRITRKSTLYTKVITVKVHFSAPDKIMRIGQNWTLEKCTRLTLHDITSIIWHNSIYADTNLCDRHLTHIIKLTQKNVTLRLCRLILYLKLRLFG